MYISTKTIQLRKTTIQAVQQLINTGKYSSEKDALLFILEQSKAKKIPSGFDKCTNPYSAYISYKKVLK